LHITSPYAFAQQEASGQSISMPLIDQSTGEFVGQVLNDFMSQSIFAALSDKNTPLSKNGFPIVISVQDDGKNNTILGPGFAVGADRNDIVSVVLSPYDSMEKRRAFEDIVKSMQAGEPRSHTFLRTTTTGKTETVHIAHAPILVRSISPVNSATLADGIKVGEYLVYSLGLCETEEGLLNPFKEIERDMRQQITWALIVLSCGIVGSTLFVIYISYLLTSSITEPMLDLLDLIRRMNR
jgi:hypothetical protein